MGSAPLRKLTLKRRPVSETASALPAPTIGERVAELRRANNLSQARLAEAIGMHATEISTLERGKHDPRLGTLRRIARGLGVSLADLVKGLD